MSDLYARILFWHKLVAQQTGGLALCSAKRKLNRDEARGWINMLRNVADDMEAFLRDGSFILDARGQRVYPAQVERASDPRTGEQEAQHVDQPHIANPKTQAAARKGGGLRIATRKKV